MKRRKINIIKIFKALSLEKRAQIYLFLRKYNYGIHLSLIAEMMKIPVGTLSRHILKLRNAGLVESKRYNNKMVYKLRSINNDFDRDLTNFLRKYLTVTFRVRDKSERQK